MIMSTSIKCRAEESVRSTPDDEVFSAKILNGLQVSLLIIVDFIIEIHSQQKTHRRSCINIDGSDSTPGRLPNNCKG